MADKRIQDLPSASSVQLNDLFVLEQSGAAMNVSGQTLVRDLATALDGHGGIANVTYTAPVAPSLNGTLTITMADETTYDVAIANGNGIASIAIAYAISGQGSTPGYVTEWYSSPVAPTDANPYQWTRIRMTDKTGTVTDAYSVSMKAVNPTISIGSVNADTGANADATVTNSGTSYNPVFNFDFTLPKGDKGDTGDYIDPVVSFGTSTSATTEPSTWYNSPSSLSYSAGNFIWQKTEYTLHEAQTVQGTEIKVIGYIGQNGTGAGSVTQITFNGDVFADDGTGNVTMNIAPDDVGAIEDPTNKSNGQVLTWDATAGKWVASTPSTGSVNTVNNVGVTTGTTNIQLYGTNIPVSASDNTPLPNAIPVASSTTPAALGTAAVGVGTTWARADHVHPMPSASDVGATSADDVKYKIYSSVSDLGLTVGSATIAGAFSAMPNYSILNVPRNEFSSSEHPVNAAGDIEIIKVGENGNLGSIWYHGRESSVGDYRMYFDSTGVPLGWWSRLPGAVIDIGVNQADSATTFGGGTYAYSDGHTVIVGIAFQRSSNYPAGTFTKAATISVPPWRNIETITTSPDKVAVMIQITSSGDINIYPYTTATKGWIRGIITYFI